MNQLPVMKLTEYYEAKELFVEVRPNYCNFVFLYCVTVKHDFVQFFFHIYTRQTI